MKKMILTGYMALMGLLTFAQNPNDAISYPPLKANGILIMNNIKFTTVKKWKVIIQTRVADVVNDKYIYTTVKSFDVIGTYYTGIDKTYLTSNYFITVQGFNSHGIVVTQQGPLSMDGDPRDNACTWQCVGKTYAYDLELYTNPNGGSASIQMNYASPPETYPYPHYYQWVSADAWPAFIGQNTPSPNTPSYYGLPGSFNPNGPGMGDLIIEEFLAPQDAVIDASNTPIHGHVYGVRKYLGPWEISAPMIISNELTGGASNCIQTFDWAMGMVNNGDVFDPPSTIPPLTCNNYSYGGGTNPPAGNSYETLYEPCLSTFADDFSNVTNDSGFETLLNTFYDCLEGNNSGGGMPISWPEHVEYIRFQAYNNGGATSTPIVLTKETMFDRNGNYIGLPLTIAKGLYHMRVKYSDKSYGRAFLNSKQVTTATFTQSDFLSASVFPVPVTGNSFSLRLTATANVKFTYTLRDWHGTKIFEKLYTVGKDTGVTDVITVPNGIPSGVLFNQLTFTDGSQINFQTIK